jgi:methionine-rich copper-binding protein CopC
MKRLSKMSLLILLAALAVTPLFAHMKLEKSEPAADATVSAPPAHLKIWFSESPDVKVSKLNLTGPSGTVKLSTPKADGKSIVSDIEGQIGDGVYTATWQSAGDDGHVQKGEFKFTVKRR